jgi:hypothetical protein
VVSVCWIDLDFLYFNRTFDFYGNNVSHWKDKTAGGEATIWRVMNMLINAKGLPKDIFSPFFITASH